MRLRSITVVVVITIAVGLDFIFIANVPSVAIARSGPMIFLAEFDNGSSPEECAREISTTARALEITIKADFNGVPMIAFPRGNWQETLGNFEILKMFRECEKYDR